MICYCSLHKTLAFFSAKRRGYSKIALERLIEKKSPQVNFTLFKSNTVMPPSKFADVASNLELYPKSWAIVSAILATDIGDVAKSGTFYYLPSKLVNLIEKFRSQHLRMNYEDAFRAFFLNLNNTQRSKDKVTEEFRGKKKSKDYKTDKLAVKLKLYIRRVLYQVVPMEIFGSKGNWKKINNAIAECTSTVMCENYPLSKLLDKLDVSLLILVLNNSY